MFACLRNSPKVSEPAGLFLQWVLQGKQSHECQGIKEDLAQSGVVPVFSWPLRAPDKSLALRFFQGCSNFPRRRVKAEEKPPGHGASASAKHQPRACARNAAAFELQLQALLTGNLQKRC